jgi:hypothetical protein
MNSSQWDIKNLEVFWSQTAPVLLTWLIILFVLFIDILLELTHCDFYWHESVHKME